MRGWLRALFSRRRRRPAEAPPQVVRDERELHWRPFPEEVGVACRIQGWSKWTDDWVHATCPTCHRLGMLAAAQRKATSR